MILKSELIKIIANYLCVSINFVKYINNLDNLILLSNIKLDNDYECVYVILDLENHFNIELENCPSNLDDLLNYINERINE